ncbi:MAG: serine hydrolase domain-containing protein [Pirellulaceae bacterium]
MMKRRTFIQCSLGAAVASPLIAAVRRDKLDAAAGVLANATADGRIHAAALYVRQIDHQFAKSYGAAKSVDDIFLLASISKPISMAALMTLYDQGMLSLDDLVKKFIPEFTADGRGTITVRQLLTHVSGLPDQLPENQTLRKRQAKLSEFVDLAVRTPLLFKPGAKYSYSSMAILLACEVASRISGQSILNFINKTVFPPLGMKHSELGLDRFALNQVMQCQVMNAAPESGAGDATAKEWDWNSLYWRKFGAPWGGVHASAPDVARFFGEFLHPAGKLFKPATARLMLQNHNRAGLTPRGLGFNIGTAAGSPGCSARTFGHTGSTGTLVWADPATDTICVVLTTLPGRAADPHPRKLTSDRVAMAVL